MLGGYFTERPLKGTISTQPLVDDNPQRILVAGRAWLALELLRGHIVNSSGHILLSQRSRAMSDLDEAKITEQDFVVPPQQDVLRLDITMDQFSIMCILQRR